MKKILLMIVLSVSLFGVPAYHGEIVFKQSDSSTFKGRLKGDPWFNWVETDDGYVAKYNENSKNYEYMILDANDELKFSQRKVAKYIKYAPSAKATESTGKVKKISSQKMGKIWKKSGCKSVIALYLNNSNLSAILWN